MRRRGGTCVGSARVVDERTRGEDPPPDTSLQCRPPLYNPRPEEACRDTPSVDREEGWDWEWMRCMSVVCVGTLVCSVWCSPPYDAANLEESVIYK